MSCRRVSSTTGLAVATLMAATPSIADQVINDDLVVIGNACSGFDCVEDMSFGDDQLVIRENNTRIGFGSNGAFILTASQSSNGGRSEFTLDTRVPVSNTGASGSASGFISAAGVTELLDGSLRVDLSQSDLSVQVSDPALDRFTDFETELTAGQVVIIPAGA